MVKARTVNQVLESRNPAGAKLSVQKLDKRTVLISGDKKSLRFLAKVITAQADAKVDDGIELSPHGAGCAWFDDASTHGVYILRTPSEPVRAFAAGKKRRAIK